MVESIGVILEVAARPVFAVVPTVLATVLTVISSVTSFCRRASTPPQVASSPRANLDPDRTRPDHRPRP